MILIIVGITILITLTILGRMQEYLVRQNEAYAKPLALHLNEILTPEFGTILALPRDSPTQIPPNWMVWSAERCCGIATWRWFSSSKRVKI
ncbi:MAG: hypothetical protein ABIV47_24935 [Roseiflexaceae bacterium]